MNPQIVVDFARPEMLKLGWRDFRLGDSLEPDGEITDVPLGLVLRAARRPRGENRTDNCYSQIIKEFFVIQVAAKREEMDRRLDELSGVLAGKVLPGYRFITQFHEGMPLIAGADIEWEMETYFTERERQDYA